MAGIFSQALQQAAERRAQLSGRGGVATQRGPGIQAGGPPAAPGGGAFDLSAMLGRAGQPGQGAASPLMQAAMRRRLRGPLGR